MRRNSCKQPNLVDIHGMASRDDHDIVELGGQRMRRSIARSAHDDMNNRPARKSSRFLSVWFRCCHVYGRMNRNAAHTAYEGRCPKCGAKVSARIGPEGTSHRMFEAM